MTSDAKTAPRRTPRDEGTVLLEGRAGRIVDGAGCEISGEPLVVLLDAPVAVDAARRAALSELRHGIQTGVDPDGRPQPPLGPRAAARERVSEHRGFASGHLADELRSPPIKGDSARAEAVVLPPVNRNVVLAAEAKRGVIYIAHGAKVAAAVDRALAEVSGAMAEGRRVEMEQGEPRAVEEERA